MHKKNFSSPTAQSSKVKSHSKLILSWTLMRVKLVALYTMQCNNNILNYKKLRVCL